MNLAEIAEVLSAFAAFFTVSLAVVELSSRKKIKKADVAMDMYAEFLYIIQQYNYALGNAEALASKYDRMSLTERQSFARTHIIPNDIFIYIQNFEQNCLCNFDFTAKDSKEKSTQILEFSGKIHNFLTSINTFYQTVLEDESYSAESVKYNTEYLIREYNSILTNSDITGDILRKNLKKTHDFSNAYLLGLIIASAVFFVVSSIL